MPGKYYLTIFLLLNLTNFGFSQNIRFYPIRHSALPEGVTCASTNEDSYGHIWFSTYNGAVRFDGENMALFQTNPDDSTTINHNIVQRIFQDGEYVYASTWGNGGVLNRISLVDHSIKRIKFKNDPNKAQSTFLKLPSGGTLVAGDFGPMYINKEWSKASCIPLPFSRLLDQEKNNQILISTRDRLLSYQIVDDSLHLVTTQDVNVHITSTAIVSGKRVYGSEQGLFSYDKTLTIPARLKHLNINYLLLDSFDRLWLATKTEGLYLWHIESGRVEHFLAGEKEGMLTTNTIISLFEDRNRILWISTPAGPLYADLNNNFIHSISFPDNTTFLNSGGYGIYGDSNDIVWIGTNHGILLYDRNTFSYLEETIPILFARQIVPLPAALETYFVASNGMGAYVIERDPLTKHFDIVTHYSHRPGQENGLSSNLVMTVLKDHYGNYWFGAYDNGIDILRPSGQWMHIDKNQLQGIAVSSLLLAKDSSIWVSKWDNGISKGFIREDGTIDFIHYSPTNSSLRYQAIAHLAEDSEETLWIATMGGGVYSLKKDSESFMHYAAPEGLTSTNIFAIEADKMDNVWCSTSDGIGLLLKEGKKFRMYKKSDGLPQNAFTFFANHVMPDGCLAFGTHTGVAIINPDSLKSGVQANPPIISRIKIYNKILQPGEGSPIKQNADLVNSLQLTYEQDLLTFEFTNQHYQDPGRVMYAYFLEGFNRDWVEIGKSNVATFTRLPPGTYKLNYRSSIDDGDSYTYGARPLEIVILPPWWKTWWFRMGLVIVVLALIYFIFRQNTERLLAIQRIEIEKKIALEAERSRISRDMHDDLGSGLSAIHLLSNYLNENASEKYPEFSTEIDKIRRSSEELNESIREIIWTVNVKDDTLNSLVLFIRRYCHELHEKMRTPVYVHADDPVPDVTLSGVQRKHIFLCLKESLNNALKHGKPTAINVYVTSDAKKEVLIRIHDNGTGFNTATMPDTPLGNGLFNMKERMKEIGGSAVIESKAGQTEVRLKFMA